MQIPDSIRQAPIAFASLVVSACALFLTLYQARITELNNRTAVLPQLQFERLKNDKEHQIELYVVNNGLGPARLSGLEAHIGPHFMRFKDRLDWPSIRSALESEGVSLKDAWVSSPGINTFLRAGDRHLLLRLPVPPPQDLEFATSRLEKTLNLGVCYCSFYADCFHVAEVSGESDERTCRYDGTLVVFGTRIRLKSPLGSLPDSQTTHGM